jgi:hypothetical protein
VDQVKLMGWSVDLTASAYAVLSNHLHRDDDDEHAAFCYAGLAQTPSGRRLIVRRVVPVVDEEFPISAAAGYRSIVPRAVARAALECDNLGLCLIWAHSHPGSTTRVGLSSQDLSTAEHTYPALSDLTHGRPVGVLVLGTDSAAGQVHTGGAPERIDRLRVVGSPITDLAPQPRAGEETDERYARQVMMFGAVGQRRLAELTVAVVGVGGGGSVIVQMLAHLGVGRLLLFDHDVVKQLNLSRIVGATPADIGRTKVEVLARLVHSINPKAHVAALAADVTYTEDAELLSQADVVFLATDTAFARHAVNLVCHQYLIPFFQVGAKVATDAETGAVEIIHVVDRPFLFTAGCMHCAGIVPLDQLQREQQSDEENRAQDYLGQGGSDIEDPSVITLNSIAASHAVTDFLMTFTGLAPAAAPSALVYYPLEREMRSRNAPRRPGCPYCDSGSETSAFARGATWPLQLRPGYSPGFREVHAEAPRPWWKRLMTFRYLWRAR